jgi:hypothetical protein
MRLVVGPRSAVRVFARLEVADHLAVVADEPYALRMRLVLLRAGGSAIVRVLLRIRRGRRDSQSGRSFFV